MENPALSIAVSRFSDVNGVKLWRYGLRWECRAVGAQLVFDVMSRAWWDWFLNWSPSGLQNDQLSLSCSCALNTWTSSALARHFGIAVNWFHDGVLLSQACYYNKFCFITLLLQFLLLECCITAVFFFRPIHLCWLTMYFILWPSLRWKVKFKVQWCAMKCIFYNIIFFLMFALRQWFSTGGARPPGGARTLSRGGASRLQDGRKKNLKKKLCKFFLSLNYCHEKL